MTVKSTTMGLVCLVAVTRCAPAPPTESSVPERGMKKAAAQALESDTPLNSTEQTESPEEATCGTGSASPELVTSVRKTAGHAGKCYSEAVRAEGKEGRVMVSVAVGPDGTVQSATVIRDEIQSPEMQTCLIAMFLEQKMPPPARGCVLINVPLNYSLKKSDEEAPDHDPSATTPDAHSVEGEP